MTPHRALACLGATAALIACSSGPGNKFISSNNPAREASEEPGSDAPGRDQTDDPPVSGEGAACLPCVSSYRCTGTIDDLSSSSQSSVFTLKRSDCQASEGKRDENILTFACGGTISIPGRTTIGNWKDVGAGVLQICFGVIGRDQCLTCKPAVISSKDDQTGGSRDAGSRDSSSSD